MSEVQSEFMAALKRQILIYAVVLLFSVIGTALGFYYNTTSSMAQTCKEVEQIKCQQNSSDSKIEDLMIKKLDRNEYREDIKEIKEILKDMNKKIDKIE